MPKKNSNCFYYLPMKLPPYIFWYIRTIQAITLQMPSSFYYILKKCQWHCAFADRSSHVSLFLSVCLCFWHAKYLKWIKISWLSFIWRGLVSDVQKLQKIIFLAFPLLWLGYRHLICDNVINLNLQSTAFPNKFFLQSFASILLDI